MYKIIELQTYADGTTAQLITDRNTREEAESEYYRVLSAAAVSNLPVHSCIVVTEEAFPVLHQAYKHAQTAEE